MKALIIDDILDMRELLSMVLEEWGIETVPAENGAVALQLLKDQGPFDFCTVDVHMPVMDGYTFVQKVRENKEWSKVKLIMVTTEVEKKSIDHALSLGADEYLMKPFMRDMVESKLRLLAFLP